MDRRCGFWLPTKRRFCANSPLPQSKFCGNHNPAAEEQRAPCPIDPSHSVLVGNIESHVKRCPMRRQVMKLEAQPFYKKGVNAESDISGSDGSSPTFVSSTEKRGIVYKMTLSEFCELVRKIKSVHSSVSGRLHESYSAPEACSVWLNKQQDRQLPFQEKHVLQQASILGNMETFGIMQKREIKESHVSEKCNEGSSLSLEDMDTPAVVEFGAGRGYLTHMLTDCYGIKKVFLVERSSYKLKADRSLRQDKSMTVERLRIDIEDLNLSAIESLKGLPYLAIGKHICGPATDLTLRCCLPKQNDEKRSVSSSVNCYLRGLALATCCHHLCQWQNYTNKKFLIDLGIRKDDFHAITWFSSWAVDADHSSDMLNTGGQDEQPSIFEMRESEMEEDKGVEAAIRNMKAKERASLGFMCKDIIDVGRLLCLEEHGLDANLVKYIPLNISPENHLLVAKFATRR